MRKLKIIGIALLSIILFSFGTGWAMENTSPALLLAAAPQLKRTTTSSTIKPVEQLVTKKPDLSIQNMSWSLPLKQGYIVGQNSILNFTIKNQGTAPSGNFIIKFTCPSCPPSMSSTRQITSIAPGTAMGYNWPDTAAIPEKWTAGTYTLEVVVDPGRVVQDTNRTNNRKILKFKVQSMAISEKKLNITKKPFSPSKPNIITTEKKITPGFDFSPPGTTGIRTVSGFDFSTQPAPGTTGIRTVTGFNFSTQPTPGTTGIRTVQGFNFIKQ